jgi:hypothetical protein
VISLLAASLIGVCTLDDAGAAGVADAVCPAVVLKSWP